MNTALSTRTKPLTATLVTAVAVASAVVTVIVIDRLSALAADVTDNVPRTIPYQGTLELDGQPYAGSISMTFTLQKLSSGSLSTVWTETQTVTVYSGRFAALLGGTSTTSVNNLTAVVTSGADLYLSITLNSGSGDVALSKPQRFYPAALAQWTTAATNFDVSGTLTAANLSVTGNLTVGGVLNLGGDLVVGGVLDMGFTNKTCSSSTTCSCDSGYRAIGGGSKCSVGQLSNHSYLKNSTTWAAQCETTSGATTGSTTYVICARVY